MLRFGFRVAAAVCVAAATAITTPIGHVDAAPTTFELALPQSVAASVLPAVPYNCTAPQQTTWAEGFDPTTGFPEANVEVTEGCGGGSGRGGGGHTYSAYTGAIWDDSGYFYALAPEFSAPPIATAYDTFGNEEFQSNPHTYFQWASGFIPVPRVVGLAVKSGSIAGGVSETLTGSGFTNATAVDFGAVTVQFTVVNDNTITVSTPAAPTSSPSSVDVTVASSAGTSQTSSADQFSYVLPTVSALSVGVGPSGGGTALTISGVGFNGATGVDIGTVPATNVSVVNDTTVTAVTAADTSIVDDATLDVSVTSAAGAGPASPADQFTYAVRPRITSITPSSVPLQGGTTLTISGADLAYGSILKIAEQQVPYTYSPDGTSIIAAAPAHDAYESVPVSFTTIGGTTASGGAATLKYVQGTPTVTLYPTSGPVGTTITASGSNFVPGEKLTVTYSTSLTAGKGNVVICTATADSSGFYGCAGPAAVGHYGKLGNHAITVTGTHGKVTDVARAFFTLT